MGGRVWPGAEHGTDADAAQGAGTGETKQQPAGNGQDAGKPCYAGHDGECGNDRGASGGVQLHGLCKYRLFSRDFCDRR